MSLKHQYQERIFWIFITSLSLFVGVFILLPPIAQDPSYHDFADQRKLWGIPNFMDVASNLSFLGIGIYGVLTLLIKDKKTQVIFLNDNEQSSYFIFFIGLIFVG